MKNKKIEIWSGKQGNSVYLSEDNIVYITVVGESGNEIVIAMKTLHEKLNELVEEKVDFRIDINRAGKSSPEVRNMGKLISQHKKIRKVAFFGSHPVARVLANFAMSVSKKKDVQFFDTEEKAISWLKK
jgi:hypothetical protein